MDNLKACPFCGGKCEIIMGLGCYFGICKQCAAKANDRRTRADAAKLWNTRYNEEKTQGVGDPDEDEEPENFACPMCTNCCRNCGHGLVTEEEYYD